MRFKNYKAKAKQNSNFRKLRDTPTRSKMSVTASNNIGYYLANMLVYLASSKRYQVNLRTINKAINYLQKLDSPFYQQKRQIWDKATIYEVGYEFKDLSDIIRDDHTAADIEKALICLRAMSDLLQNKGDILNVAKTIRARQVMHELRHGLKLSLSGEKVQENTSKEEARKIH